MKRRLLVVGLDGLTPELLPRIHAEVGLPHLMHLEGEALTVALEPGEDRYTGLAWEQFSTGSDVASGGRPYVVEFDPRTYVSLQTTGHAPPFTAGLAARVVAFDVPYFHVGAGGAQGLARWGAHDPGVLRHAVPASLEAEVLERFGPYPAQDWIYGFVWPDVDATRRMGEDLVRAVERRIEVTRWLFTERLPDWDLGLTVVAELHSAAEALWHGIDPTHPLHDHPSAPIARRAFLDVMAATDALVGELRAAVGETDLLVFTPHGMATNHADVAAMLLLPELLLRAQARSRAFAAPASWSTDGRGPTPWPAGRDWSHVIASAFEAPRVRRGRRSAPDAAAQAYASLEWMPAAQYGAAWPRLRAMALPSFYDSRVRLNLKGREARGRVRPKDRERALDDIEALLDETRDLATGGPLPVQVVRTAHDDPLRLGPWDTDLVLRWTAPCLGLEHPRLGRIGPAPWRRTGGHTGGPGRLWWAGTPGRLRCEGLGSPATVSAAVAAAVTRVSR